MRALLLCFFTLSFFSFETSGQKVKLSFFPYETSGQKIKILESTSQGWAGGVCCRSGVNYHYTIEFPKFNPKKEPIPDTIWADGNCIPLAITDSVVDNYQHNVQRIKSGKKIIYKISIGTSHDEREMMDPTYKKPKPAPIQYNGTGLLSYHEKGKNTKKYFILTVKKALSFESYP